MSFPEIASFIAWLCLAVSLLALCLTAINGLWMRKSARTEALETGPLVSVLVPARDEEEDIAACLDSLLAQRYQPMEIIVYDDDSSDKTAAILDSYASAWPEKLRVIHGKGLESGWYGKPKAMQVLFEAARGKWLYYTDADTLHEPDSVGFSLALAGKFNSDLVSGYVQQRIGSLGEALVVPAMYLLSMFALPIGLVHHSSSPAISHAIGQSMLFKRSVLVKLGGFFLLKNKVSEDVHMARLIKRQKGRVLFADLKDHISCRMYEDYSSAIIGFSKNVYDYFGKKKSILIVATAGIAIVLLLPIVASLWLPSDFEVAQKIFRFSCLFMFDAWTLLILDRRLPWYLPFFYPVLLINVLSTAWRAARLFSTGRAVEWKGRMVR
jgi:chlorobactene glucosyltransferase